MALITQNLILASTLFLSPSHPALVSNTTSQVWFSEPNSLEVQALDSGLLLKVTKQHARLQATGLQKQSPKEWNTLQAISDANYLALTRCPSFPVQWKTGLEIPLFSPANNTSLDTWLAQINDCGFDEISFDEQNPLFSNFQKNLLKRESESEWKGIRILQKSWKEGRKVYVVENNSNQSSRLSKTLGPYSPFVKIEERESPKPGNTLIFEVTLFEFSRQAASKLGVSWPEQIRMLSLEGNLFKDSFKALEVGLDFGESFGVGRVLAKPQIRVKAGQTSKFHSGGEIPIQIITAETQKTEWKKYGLLLEIGVPKETSTGAREVSVDFKVELSEPDFSMGAETSPGLSVRRLESQFDLRVRESTVLSTMIQTNSGARRSGLSGLSRIPILKNVFSSKSQQDHESELWFAIRPMWDEMPWSDDLEKKGLHDISNL